MKIDSPILPVIARIAQKPCLGFEVTAYMGSDPEDVVIIPCIQRVLFDDHRIAIAAAYINPEKSFVKPFNFVVLRVKKEGFETDRFLFSKTKMKWRITVPNGSALVQLYLFGSYGTLRTLTAPQLPEPVKPANIHSFPLDTDPAPARRRRWFTQFNFTWQITQAINALNQTLKTNRGKGTDLLQTLFDSIPGS